MMERILLCLLLFITNVYSDERVDPLVLISSQGLVRGLRATDGDYSIFLGIPYAQVNTEDPFGPARSPSAFKEIIYTANDGSVKCPQMTNTHTEDENEALDCLRLNIYVPFKASYTNPMPVLVWIHGGEFERGSSGEYGVSELVKHDVLVVTINYRLGPYGFLCLDIPEVSGNQGLKDQYIALNWIKTNIASFGGNPYNVTVAGQDAGATSVLLHLYSNKELLFQKAIVESGTPQSEEMFTQPDTDAVIKIASHLGMNTTDTREALKYLENSSHELVTAAAYDLNLELKPCKERVYSGIENFVENEPLDLSNQKKVNKMSVLIGYNSLERDSLIGDYFKTDPFYNKLKNNFNLAERDLENAAQVVKRFYIGYSAVSEDVITELERFESDFGHNHPSERQVTKLLKENVNAVYKYLFSYVNDADAKGAGHSAELSYLFNKGAGRIKKSEDDLLITERITKLWTDFAKYGNPTPNKPTDLIPLTWPSVTKDKRPTLVIDTDIRIEGGVFNDRMAFWDLFYYMYGNLSTLSRDCSNSPYMCC